jgi:DNA polymerase V
MFALVDVNNMYVSCERVFQPWLAGRPVVVLSNNDGCAIARSNEAKDLGVAMAQPWFQIRHLERQAGLVALSANFELYGDMSSRMMTIVARYAPRQEVYSIDECFLDFDGVRGHLVGIGREIRATVLRWTGLPTSIGFGITKTLAKLANHVAKTAERKPGSYPRRLAQVCSFAELSSDELAQVMRGTDVGEVWGVGPRTRARLNDGGIRTVFDLVNADAAALHRQFSVVLEKILLELRGTPCLDVDDAPPANRQILCSRSLGAPVSALPELVEIASRFASRVADKARGQRSVAGAVHVFIRTSPFRRNDRQHSASATLPLRRPTADTRVLASSAVRALEAIYKPGFHYLKIGVMLLELQPEANDPRQPELFDGIGGECDPCNHSRLMGVIDALNHRFGRGAVVIASGASAAARSGSTGRQERRSPRYTTRLDEIPLARV